MRFADSRILIFAKAPVAGEVKTRLHEVMDPERAARLHTHMLTALVDRVACAGFAPVDLLVTPAIDHPVFTELSQRFDVRLQLQSQGDLGARMAHAAERALLGVDKVVLLGVDCPGIDGDYLVDLLCRLSADCPVVLGPAEDGGYVALGLTRTDRRLFEDIDWGTGRVMSQTLDRLHELDWSYDSMPELWDVDRPVDLDRLKASYPHLIAD